MGICCGYHNIKTKSKSPTIAPVQLKFNLNVTNQITKIDKNQLYDLSLSDVSNCSDKTRLSYSSFKFDNGDIYTGEHYNKKPNGEGKLISPSGTSTSFIGQWKDGLPHGLGLEIYGNNKGKFQGEYINGVKNGYGKIFFEDGSIFEGDFKNNDINGFGILIWPDNKKYEGNWRNNKMNGKGKMTWENGMIYEGEYLNNKKHGFGVFVWPDNKKIYCGYWNNGKMNGKGMMLKKNKKINGIWDNGKLLNENNENYSIDFLGICQEKKIGLIEKIDINFAY